MKSYTLLALTVALAGCGGGNSSPTGPGTPQQAQLSLSVATRPTGLTSNGIPGINVRFDVRETAGVAATFEYFEINGKYHDTNPIEAQTGSKTIGGNARTSWFVNVFLPRIDNAAVYLTDANGYHHSLSWVP